MADQPNLAVVWDGVSIDSRTYVQVNGAAAPWNNVDHKVLSYIEYDPAVGTKNTVSNLNGRGPTAMRYALGVNDRGALWWDTTKGYAVIWDGTQWADGNGFPA